ncbi:TPA: hypothetical protein N0F65_010653 [Lagenidium giganteum]|uniref:Uncharacterized protein n=1 Tax=Lagenidium giganteum TaxID=4803 RepID=A0AAV2ZD96_9STRA|nr:TPA: hypothetical protein N0F65_010653 [Lagenidium giganteum]
MHAALQLLALFVFPIPRYFNRTCGQIGCAAGTPTEQIAANRVFHEIVVFPRQDKVPQVYTVSDATAPSFVVQFDELALLPGDSLVVRDAAACSSLRLTANNTTQSFSRMEDAPNSAGAVMIHGASVVVEYFPSLSTLTLPVYRPERDNAVAKIRLHVRSGVAAYFRSPVSRSNSESIVGGRNEMKEAVCYKRSRPQMYAHAKAVARLTITKQSKNPITTSDLSSDRGNSALSDSKDEDDVIYCTGWLLGRGNHMMTNYHCLFSMPSVLKDVPVGRFATNHGEESDERMIAQRFQNITSTSVNFMAETQHCNDRGTTGEKLGVIEATNVTVVAANEALDYCLLRVDMAPSLVERLQRKGPCAVFCRRVHLPATVPQNRKTRAAKLSSAH